MSDTGAPEQVSFGRRLSQLAERHGDDWAVVHDAADGTDTPVSWAELERRANQVGRALEARGVGEGDLIVVGLPNAPEHLFTTFAGWKVGASVLPLRDDLPAWERERLLEVARPKAVVADWPDTGQSLMSTADIAGTRSLPSTPPPDRVPRITRLIASSGSTGRPKIIASDSPGVITDDPQLAAAVGAAEDDIYLVTSPLYHTNGNAACYTPLINGTKVVLMERFDAVRAVELIEHYRVGYTIMVPTMLQRIARLPDVATRDFSSLKRVLYGGAPVPEWVVRAWFELVPPANFWFSYGSSERVGLVMTDGEGWLAHPGTVGRRVDCELRILDHEGREAAPGEVGEIFMRSGNPEPFQYIGQPTPEPTADNFHSVGDLGWVDEEGWLYIADRRQDMVISGGANIFPAEVESALSEHPALADVVVVGVPDPEWGQRVHAIVEPVDAASAPAAAELRAWAKERLASYKVPKTWETVAHLPRTAAGKVNRSALAAERAANAESSPRDSRLDELGHR